MWLVRIALKRPYTFVVMAMLIVILGVLSIVRMPTDIFPDIDIPVISVIWNYGGLLARGDGEAHRHQLRALLTTTVNDIEHIESQSLTGIVDRQDLLPAGREDRGGDGAGHGDLADGRAPDAAGRDAAVHHPLQRVERARSCRLALESDSLSEQQLFDYGTNFVRADMATIQGAQIPWPVRRQAAPDHGRHRSRAALRVGPLAARRERGARRAERHPADRHGEDGRPTSTPCSLNSSPEALEEIGDCPIKTVNGTTVYMRDVANVRDGYSPQTNMVHVDGKRSVLMSILKNGNASTLDVGAAHPRDAARRRSRELPKELKVSLLFDQSLFVRAAVDGVVKEALIAAGAHRAHDPAVPRQLAQHADRRHLDPALDPGLDHRARAARPDAQRHDARRHGAGGRHPRRRRHGRDREHPPQHGAEEAARARDPRRRAADRGRRRSSRRSASASCSCRSRSSPARRSRCSCRSRWRSSSRC